MFIKTKFFDTYICTYNSKNVNYELTNIFFIPNKKEKPQH